MTHSVCLTRSNVTCVRALTRALNKSQIKLAAMKSEYDKERTAFRARRDAFKESVFAISLENERARSDLQALRLECAELEQVEMEQCERYACRCCSTNPSEVSPRPAS